MFNIDTKRTIFRSCEIGMHVKCPGVKTSEVYRKDPLMGRIPTGKQTRVYCECSCHAHPGKPPGKDPE